MLWYKSFHIIAVISWFAGLFYLPRLFVYHAMTKSISCSKMLKIMEYKLYYYIMNPAMCLSLVFGLMTLNEFVIMNSIWIYIKIVLTLLLVIFHFYLGKILKVFKQNRNKKNHKFYRIINEIPTVILIFIVILVVIKPF